MHRALRSIAVLICGAALSGVTLADEPLDTGRHLIYFNALPTQSLTPQVARLYGIRRSQNQALLNVTVRRKDDGLGSPVPAAVTANATNLNGQLRNVEMKQVDEGEAIYYIGVFPVSNRETLDFVVSVRPESDTPQTITFRRQFFTN